MGDTDARRDEVPCQWAILGAFKVQDRPAGLPGRTAGGRQMNFEAPRRVVSWLILWTLLAWLAVLVVALFLFG